MFVATATTTAFAQSETSDSLSLDNQIFEKIEVEARYPGGDKAWMNYLTTSPVMAQTLKKAAKKVKKAGKYQVIVQFVIDKDGNVAEVEAITNHGFGLEEGAEEIIRKSGKWIPAKSNGKKVKVYRKQPITFVFE